MEEGALQDAAAVRVAVRVRPLITRELLQGSRQCISTDGPCVTIGRDRRFTFDHAFGPSTKQEHVYREVVSPLVESCFDGFNVTVLAYGQTGSGKTYTMGTGECRQEEQLGIAPRVIRHLFQGIEARKQQATFHVRAQFLEIYNEDVKDLLLPPAEHTTRWISREPGPGGAGAGSSITLRDAGDGTIMVIGASEQPAGCAEDLLELLERGMAARATSNTFANEQSSRSHAILTIVIEQHVLVSAPDGGSSSGSSRGSAPSVDESDGGGSMVATGEFRTAKLHLVDLAGSERTKQLRSSMQGNGARFRETVNINQGLLALGNVISALGDERRRGSHVPYRESKLTRLLQDSLGGNSRTAMIACVSPADDVLEETLNTLKYANRAKNIRNKPVVNRASSESSLSPLRGAVLEVQLHVLQQLIAQLPDSLLARGLPLAELRALDMGDPAACLDVLMRMKSALAASASDGGAADSLQRTDSMGRPQGPSAASGANSSASFQADGEEVSSLLAGCGRAIAGILQGLAEMEAQGHVDKEGREHILRSLDASTLRLLPAVRSVGLHRSASAGPSSAEAGAATARSASARLPSSLDLALESAASNAAERSEAKQPPVVANCEGRGTRSERERQLEEKVKSLQSELASCRAELREARDDLDRDEIIFADKMKELQEARTAAAESQQQLKDEQERHATEVADLRKQLAELEAPRQQQQQSLGHHPGRLAILNRLGCRSRSRGRPVSGSGSGMLSGRHSNATTAASSRAASADGDASTAQSRGEGSGESEGERGAEEDEVLYDEEILSYISETDYTEQHRREVLESDAALREELAEVLREKAAAEAERAALERAALAQRSSFDTARAAMEQQLSQLAGNISRQQQQLEAAQAAEREARELATQWQERAQELESAIQAREAALAGLRGELAAVEGCAARSAEERAELRQQYEQRIAAVVTQVTALQRQLQQHESGGGDKRERQQTSERAALVEAELARLRTQQADLRKQLSERISRYERDNAERVKELSALRKAATTARNRMQALEQENRAQRLMLREKQQEVLHAQQQLRDSQRAAASGAITGGGSSRSSSPGSRGYGIPRGYNSIGVVGCNGGRGPSDVMGLMRSSQGQRSLQGAAWNAGPGSRQNSPGPRRNTPLRASMVSANAAGRVSGILSPLQQRLDTDSGREAGSRSPGRDRMESQQLPPPPQQQPYGGSDEATQQQPPQPQPLTPEQQQELSDWAEQLLGAVAEAASVEARLEVLSTRQRELLGRRDKVLRDQSQLGLRTQRRAEQLAQAVAACNAELAELVARIPSPRYDTPASSAPGTPRGGTDDGSCLGAEGQLQLQGGGGDARGGGARGSSGGVGFGGSRSLLSDDWVALQQRIADVSHSKAALEERLRSGRLLEEREQQALDSLDDQLEDLDTQLSYIAGELADHRTSLAQLHRRREQLQQRSAAMAAEGLRLALAAATDALGQRAFQVRQLEAALAASESGAARREAALQVRLRESLVSLSAHLASLEATSPGSSVSLNSAGLRSLLGMYLDTEPAGPETSAGPGPYVGPALERDAPGGVAACGGACSPPGPASCAAVISGQQLHAPPHAGHAIAAAEVAAAQAAGARCEAQAQNPQTTCPVTVNSGCATTAATSGVVRSSMPRVPRLALPLRNDNPPQPPPQQVGSERGPEHPTRHSTCADPHQEQLRFASSRSDCSRFSGPGNQQSGRGLEAKPAVEAFEEGVELSMRALPVKPPRTSGPYRQQPRWSGSAGSSWDNNQQAALEPDASEEEEEELAMLERSCGGSARGSSSVRSSGSRAGDWSERSARPAQNPLPPPQQQLSQPQQQQHPHPAPSYIQTAVGQGGGGILRRAGSMDSHASSCSNSGSFSGAPSGGSAAKRVTWSAYVGNGTGANGPALAAVTPTALGGLGQGGGLSSRGRAGSILDRAAAGLLTQAGRGAALAAPGWEVAEGQGGGGGRASDVDGSAGCAGEEQGRGDGGNYGWAGGVRDIRDSFQSRQEGGGTAVSGSKVAWGASTSVVPGVPQQERPHNQQHALLPSSFDTDDTVAATDTGGPSDCGGNRAAAAAAAAANSGSAKTGIRSYDPWRSPDPAKQRQSREQLCPHREGGGEDDLLSAQDSDLLHIAGGETSMLSIASSEGGADCSGRRSDCGHVPQQQPQQQLRLHQQQQQLEGGIVQGSVGRYSTAARYGGDSYQDSDLPLGAAAAGIAATDKRNQGEHGQACGSNKGSNEDELEEQLRLLEQAVATVHHQKHRLGPGQGAPSKPTVGVAERGDNGCSCGGPTSGTESLSDLVAAAAAVQESPVRPLALPILEDDADNRDGMNTEAVALPSSIMAAARAVGAPPGRPSPRPQQQLPATPLAAPGRSSSPMQHYSKQHRYGSGPGPGPFTSPVSIGAKMALSEALMPYKAHLRRSGTPLKAAAATTAAVMGHPSTPDGRRIVPAAVKAGFTTPQHQHNNQQPQQRPRVACDWGPGIEDTRADSVAQQQTMQPDPSQQHRQQARYQLQPWRQAVHGTDVLRTSEGAVTGCMDMGDRQAAMVREVR